MFEKLLYRIAKATLMTLFISWKQIKTLWVIEQISAV